MPNLKEVRELPTIAYLKGKLIEEFFLFFELNTSSNLDLNYSKYPGFTLENNSEDVFLQNFSLEKTI